MTPTKRIRRDRIVRQVMKCSADELRQLSKHIQHMKLQRKLDQKMAEFLCVDCGYQTLWDEYYALTDNVWQETGLHDDDGMLCIGCVENRIDRKLTVMDFDPEASINWCTRDMPMSRKSMRLLERLGISSEIWNGVLKTGGALRRVDGRWIHTQPETMA